MGLKSEIKDVRGLDVYRRNGVEAFTDLETVNEVNAFYGLSPELVKSIAAMRREPGQQISGPIFRRAVETMQPEEVYETTRDGRVLTVFQPLRNLAECHGCHGADHKTRGIVQVSLSLDKLDAEINTERNRRMIMAIMTIGILSLCLVLFLGRVVLRPVAQVAAVARRIGSGDFDTEVDVKSEDEIGQLGKAINDMRSRLKQAYKDLEARNKALNEALNSLKESINVKAAKGTGR